MNKFEVIINLSVQRKSLTIEEKIARAQEKVRQRAEKRRQQYDSELLKQQRFNTHQDHDNTPSYLSQDSTANNFTKTVHHEHELANASEIEISHEPCNPSVHKSIESDLKDNEETDFVGSELVENKTKINLVESNNQPRNNTQDPLITQVPESDPCVNVADTLLNEHLIDNGLVAHGGVQLIKENDEVVDEANESQELEKDSFEQHLSKPMNASSELKPFLPTDNDNANDIPQTNIDLGPVSCEIADTVLINATQNEQTPIGQDITNSITSNNVEVTSDIVNENEEANEDSQQINTIDISFKEPPTTELQDSQIKPDTLESLLESNTDNDIITLINDEINQDGFTYNTAMDSYKIAESSQIHENTNEHNLIENNFTENNIGNHNGDETSTNKLSQINNQDGNMDLETAAVTIQKVFRTFLFKSRASSTFGDSVNDDSTLTNEDEKNKDQCDFNIAGSLNERRSHGLTRMDTVLQTVNEEKSLSLSTDDSSTLSSAATVIQAHVRGFLVRHKLNSNKTVSTNSLAASNSNEPSLTSLEMDNEQNKNKTILNIHIVPEGGNYMSRDESLITSMDLSLDSSPPSSINLHPLGYDKSERRKQLKREDAIQSISPPSNNSGKLSEDSVKELPLNDVVTVENQAENNTLLTEHVLSESTSVENATTPQVENEGKLDMETKNAKMTSDEMDVVSPFMSNETNNPSDNKLMHSGEFHDVVLPTKVSRSDTSVASEFKNVLVYFLLWNNS